MQTKFFRQLRRFCCMREAALREGDANPTRDHASCKAMRRCNNTYHIRSGKTSDLSKRDRNSIPLRRSEHQCIQVSHPERPRLPRRNLSWVPYPMISHEHRIIFIHIPKCAGTSIEHRFGHLEGFSGRRVQDHRPMRMLEAPAPLSRALQSRDDAILMLKRAVWPFRTDMNPRNKLTVTPDQFKSYYKFTIIRDPWTRVYSWYRNVLKDPIHRKKRGVSEDTTLADFIERFAGHGMLAPAEWWLKCFDGSIRLDHVIRFDDIQGGFASVLRDLGLPQQPLEKHNVGGGAVDLGAVYDARAREIIASLYADEIRRFDFAPPA